MRTQYNLVLIEDEDSCYENLKKVLSLYSEKNGIAFHLDRFKTGEEFLSAYHGGYDLVFMDIRLPGISGMETAYSLRKKDGEVALIFLTYFSQFAVQSYEVSALDYMIKPVSYRTFEHKFKRALEILSKKEEKKLVISSKEETHYLGINEILYIEVRGHHLLFHKTDNSLLDVCGSLTNLEQELSPYGFSRCNSCYLVNLKYVTGFTKETVKLTPGVELAISKRRKKPFEAEFSAYLGARG